VLPTEQNSGPASWFGLVFMQPLTRRATKSVRRRFVTNQGTASSLLERMHSMDALWIGDFTENDRAEINHLRAAQAACVANGEVEAYAQLCTDDVASMITGHDLVAGRENFIAFQNRLFSGAKFPGMRKHPFRIERSGDIAVEIGRQEIASGSAGFAAKQKYSHVMRKTTAGWRFCVLMSNNSGTA
jgi:ketosteroid isomerase-like protein